MMLVVAVRAATATMWRRASCCHGAAVTTGAGEIVMLVRRMSRRARDGVPVLDRWPAQGLRAATCSSWLLIDAPHGMSGCGQRPESSSGGDRPGHGREPSVLPAGPISGVHGVGKPLKLGLEGLHSARRGDYRVIYRIDDDHRRVDIVAIEHRSDIYRPRQP